MYGKKLSITALKGRVSLFAMALLATLSFSAAIMPSTASAAWVDCVDGRVCFWTDSSGNGSMGWVPSSNTTCMVFTSPFANNITSVWNRTYYPVRFYTKDTCSRSIGYWYTVDPGQQINFTSWPHADNFESMLINP